MHVSAASRACETAVRRIRPGSYAVLSPVPYGLAMATGSTNGGESKPFKYRDLGSMASIARFSAVVDFRGLRVSGFLGWLMWVFVHLTFLTGFKNRFTALFKWVTSFVGRSRDERTISILQASARVIAASAGVKPGEEELTRFVAGTADDSP